MKKKYICAIIISIAFFLLSAANSRYSMQPPFNYTGAEGSTCGQCHGNFNTGGGSIVASGLPVGFFTEGQEYDFSITLAHPTTRGRWGFSIDARDANNQPVGSFSDTNPNAAPNQNELSHFMAVFQSGNSFTYDRLKWTAPVNPTEAQKFVKFYYIGNAANGDRGLTGDFIYSGTTTAISPQPNQAPALTITSPSNNSSFAVGAPIALNASATDIDGTVKKVEFYDRGVKFLVDSVAPYGYESSDVEAGNYIVTAKAFDNDGDSTVSDTVRIAVTACTPAGTISGEGFTNIPGTQVSDMLNNPTYPGSPSIVAQLTSFEYSNVGDNYGARLSGYICAPQTGNYTFYIAGDDQAGLFLSTNEDSVNKALIAYNLTPVGFRAWTARSTQKSASIRLIKGARYYVETLHKQSNGINHLSVGWVLPNGIAERPIPGSRLSPWSPANITQAKTFNFKAVSKDSAVGQTANDFGITAAPNPTSEHFILHVNSKSHEPLLLIVTDINGRVLERKSNPVSNGSIQFGSQYQNGIYFAEIIQGNRRQKLKLIKAN